MRPTTSGRTGRRKCSGRQRTSHTELKHPDSLKSRAVDSNQTPTHQTLSMFLPTSQLAPLERSGGAFCWGALSVLPQYYLRTAGPKSLRALGVLPVYYHRRPTVLTLLKQWRTPHELSSSSSTKYALVELEPAGGVRAGVQIAARRRHVGVPERCLHFGKGGATVEGMRAMGVAQPMC